MDLILLIRVLVFIGDTAMKTLNKSYKEVLLIAVLSIMIASCSNDTPYNIYGVFDTCSKPLVKTYICNDNECDCHKVDYTTLAFHVQVSNSNLNSRWFAYWSEKPITGPDNGEVEELSDPFSSYGYATQLIRLRELKPNTTYYCNACYIDENGDTYWGNELCPKTKEFYTESNSIEITDFNKVYIIVPIRHCDFNKTTLCLYISERENCPLEEARKICSNLISDLTPPKESNWRYCRIPVDNLAMGQTYYVSGYMECNGVQEACKETKFTMSDLELSGPHIVSGITSILAHYEIRWNNGKKFPSEFPDIDCKLWMSTQKDVMNDPNAICFGKENLQMAINDETVSINFDIEDLKPSTDYYSCLQIYCQGKEYRSGVDFSKTHHVLTQLNGQNKAILYTQDGYAFEAVLVKAGTYMMGATNEQLPYANENENPAHEVTISHDFYIATYETTAEFLEKMEYSSFYTGKTAAGGVSRQTIQGFCDKLTKQIGYLCRLPTEAEWEYAARGGHLATSVQTLYAGSNDYDEVCVAPRDAEDGPYEVGTKAPNILGLYDMSGNVWEACSDVYDENYYSISPSVDPKGPSYKSNSLNVARGGSFYESKDIFANRVSVRGRAQLDYNWGAWAYRWVGFRIVIEP